MSVKSVKFHIENNDYFGTLASILSLINQTLDSKKFKKINIKILSDLEKDLLYLQKKYKILK